MPVLSVACLTQCPQITEESKDMIRRLLVTEPSHRLTAAQVLDHAWVRGEALAPAERTSGPEKLTALRRLTQSSRNVILCEELMLSCVAPQKWFGILGG